jgi:hypothetical protein
VLALAWLLQAMELRQVALSVGLLVDLLAGLLVELSAQQLEPEWAKAMVSA